MLKTLKAFRFVILGLLILGITATASAQAPPGDWISGITCQNLSGTTDANIALSFYAEGNGTAVLTYNDPNPVPSNGSRNYFTPSSPPGIPSDFLGSVVVSSTQPMSCNVNTQTTGAGTQGDPYRIGTSSGFDENQIATTMYAPQVMKSLAGIWSSYIAVQNTGDSAVLTNINYKDRFGASVPGAAESFTIPAKSNKVFYQDSNSGLSSDFLGSATITGDGSTKLAVIVNFYNSGADYTTSQFHSYNGFGAGANKLLIPRVVRSFYGYNSGLTIQNVGGSPTTVAITFYFAGSPYVYNSPSIASGASLFLYAPNVTELNPVDGLSEGLRIGNAVVQAAQGGTIIAIINEDNRGGPGVPAERLGQGSTYNAILDGSQTVNAFFVQVPRNAGGIFSGGFMVANTTGSAGTCDFTYSGVPAASETGVPLPANGNISKYAPNVANLPDGFNSSVTAVCTQAVVGIANLAAEPGSGKYGDSFTQSNGLNQ
jgi:hypothetical protein